MKDKANKGYWQRLAKIYAPLMESDKKFYNAICGAAAGVKMSSKNYNFYCIYFSTIFAEVK